MKITVIGGTGYAGTAITQEAAKRGHEVTVYSRNLPASKTAQVQYTQGSVFDEDNLVDVIDGSEVIVASLSPRGELEGKLGTVYATVAKLADKAGARLLVVGGFGTLRPATGKPRFVDGDDFPKEYAPEAKELANFFAWLSSDAPNALDWTYVSPAATFGAHSPGTAKNTYRTSGEIALFDDHGVSAISGEDFGLAVIDEIEQPTTHRSILSTAY